MYIEFGAMEDEHTFQDIESGKCFYVKNSEDIVYMKLNTEGDEYAKSYPYNAVNLGDGSLKIITDGTKVCSFEFGVTVML